MTTTPNTSSAPLNITILGGGSFGTALSDISAENGHDVRLWVRNEEQALGINTDHTNHRYLPGFSINPKVKAVTSIQQALEGSQVICIAVPSKAFRSVVQQATRYLSNKIVISTTKGIEPKTFDLMSEILKEETDNTRIGVLSGPNLAREIVAKHVTATVIASHVPEVCETTQNILHCSYFRVYASKDPYGVELAGALKNIYAIVSGMGAAMNMGENTKSMLITRSLAEMSRFAVQMGANPMTFLGLAGVGDLIATCTSELSRNYRVGLALGQGKSLSEAEQVLGQVAEGINTLKQVRQKSRELNVYMPIVEALHCVIFEDSDTQSLIKKMMLREQKTDVEFTLQ